MRGVQSPLPRPVLAYTAWSTYNLCRLDFIKIRGNVCTDWPLLRTMHWIVVEFCASTARALVAQEPTPWPPAIDTDTLNNLSQNANMYDVGAADLSANCARWLWRCLD